MKSNHPLESIYIIQTGQYNFYTPALLVCPRTSNAYNRSGPVGVGVSDRVEVVAKLRVQLCVDGSHELLRDLKEQPAANTTSIEGEQAEFMLQHGQSIDGS